MIKAYIAFEQIFPADDKSKKNLIKILSNLNREVLFEATLKINNFISSPNIKDEKRQIIICKEIVPQSLYPKIKAIFDEDINAVLFFRGQLLELIINVFKYSNIRLNNENDLSTEINQIKYFKALLICSELWSNRIYSIFEASKGYYYNYAIAFRKGIQQSIKAGEHYFYIGRVYHLYKIVFKNIVRNFESIFLKSVGLSLDDYFFCFGYFIIFSNFLIENTFGIFEKEKINTAITRINVFPKFLKKFSKFFKFYCDARNINEYHSLVLKFPLIEFKKNILIGDYINFLECFINGPLFIIKTFDNKENWFSRFGTAIELYIIDLLKRVFPISNLLTNRSHYNLTYLRGKKKFEIDWCLENIQSIIFSEIKCSFLPENRILVEQPSSYLDIINERYGISNNDTKKSVKGIGQLTRHIKAYIDGIIPSIDKYKKIYPVLITYDNFIGVPITSRYLNNEFKKLFTPESTEEYEFIKYKNFLIAPLIIITLKELEYLENTLRHYTLEKLFDDYINYNKSGNEPLINFFSSSNYKIYPNTYFADKGLELIKQVAKKIIPKEEQYKLKFPEKNQM